MATLAAVLTLFLADEAALRDAFAKEFKAKDAAKRIEAVKKLAGSKEEKSILLLAGALKDADKGVRKAAAETIEGCTDEGGAAIKPLSVVLANKQEGPDVRLACAKALGKAKYKVEPIQVLIDTISGISNQDRELFEFGSSVTGVLEEFAGDKFGRDKRTAELWQNWWKDNLAKTKQEDDKRREEYKKSQKK